MAHRFQYWDGAAWQTEAHLVRWRWIDTLGYPAALEVTIGDRESTKEATYSDYQKVRMVDVDSTNRINYVAFYGKLEVREPGWEAPFGQVLVLGARDNLQELIKRTVNTSYSGTTYTTRSGLIAQIVADHSRTGNIDTGIAAKFTTSAVTEAAGVLDLALEGSGKNSLQLIQELSREDPRAATPSSFAYDFYLDTSALFDIPNFSTCTQTPKMFYFQRGAIPSGGASTRGLTVQFRATSETNQRRQMLPDYVFPKATKELVSLVRIEYLASATIPDTEADVVATELDTILYFDTLVNVFSVGETITGGTSATTATVVFVGSGFLCISSWSGTFTLNETITGGTSGATARVTNVPRQTWEQDIEVVVRGYNILQQREAHVKAASLLFTGSTEIERGEFGIVRFPYYKLTGTHTGADNAASLTDAGANFAASGVYAGMLIRNTTDGSSATTTTITATQISGGLAGGTQNDWDTNDAYEIYIPIRVGHVIRVINSLASVNGDYAVTRIEYNEGPGVSIARIQVVSTTKGLAASRTEFERVGERVSSKSLAPLGTPQALKFSTLTTESFMRPDPVNADTLELVSQDGGVDVLKFINYVGVNSSDVFHEFAAANNFVTVGTSKDEYRFTADWANRATKYISLLHSGGIFYLIPSQDDTYYLGDATHRWKLDYASLPLTQTFTAGENITNGYPVYISSDNTVSHADNTNRPTLIGIADETRTLGQSVRVVVYGPKLTTADIAISAGELVSSSATLGRVTTIADTHNHAQGATDGPSATTTVASTGHTHTSDSGGSHDHSFTTALNHNHGAAGLAHTHTQGDTGIADGSVGNHQHTNPTTAESVLTDDGAHGHSFATHAGHTHTIPAGSGSTTVPTDTHTHTQGTTNSTSSLGILLGKAIDSAAGVGDPITVFVTLG